MRYQKFQPSAEFRPFLECYFVWDGKVSEPLDVQSPPNSFCSMVFNYSNPYEAYQYNGTREPVPLAFVSGQFTSNYHLVLNGKIGMVGIVFKPTTLHNIFGLRMSQLVNSRMPLSLLLGKQADQLLDAVKVQTSDKERIDLIERFVSDFHKQARTNLSVIDEAVEYMDSHRGSVSVEAVAAHFKISRRYLEKKFLEKVGVSPKFYNRIKRFSSLSNIIAHSKKIDWQELIMEYGFHDQSHLIKEFLEFNQMNPSDYHRVHTEMTRFLKR